MKLRIAISISLLVAMKVLGQQTFPINGVHDQRDVYHAFTNATIYVRHDLKLEAATLLIKDGIVHGVGTSVVIPPETVIHDCKGSVIYPSFIDVYSGIAGVSASSRVPRNRESESKNERTAANWNPAIAPERNFSCPLPLEKKVSDDWLASGFSIVNVHQRDGIMRGTSQLLLLGVEQPNEAIIADKAARHYSFSKGTSPDPYPSSFVGAVALLRQTFYDALWYNKRNALDAKEFNPSLSSLNDVGVGTNIFELNHSLSARNVQDLSTEFNIPFVIKGTGMEYLVREELSKGMPVIVPLHFPKAMDVRDPYLAQMVSLREMKHWEAAPFNAYFLSEGGVPICMTRDTLKTAAQFIANLQRAILCGLTHDKALEALTTTPARILGQQNVMGSLDAGKLANFFVSNKNFDQNGFVIQEHWSRGMRSFTAQPVFEDMVGTYNLVIDKKEFELSLEKTDKLPYSSKVKEISSGEEYKAEINRQGELLNLNITVKDTNASRLVYSLSGKISLNGTLWDGRGLDSKGQWITWAAVKGRAKSETAKVDVSREERPLPPAIRYPNMAYGRDSADGHNTFIITNARAWTSTDKGIIKGADIYVVNGKIQSVTTNSMFPPEIKRIDAGGRHVTPGLIDEHSHIALRGGVNEGAQSSSAEVRMSDAIDPWNINIYRQLAGGVTTAQLLHGSANPVGGQSALVKLKWGESASGMLIDDAPGFIKFALGENVKRSTSSHNTRFPNTRMGVEQSIADVFVRAKEYKSLSSSTVLVGSKRKKTPPISPDVRTDLELECIAEILEGERYITCHSYVQSEILMLIALADSLDFKVNTFTHILEGYKVSAEMKEHGACASTFSDWWAYKFEVNDAIPYNAALLTRSGITTAINSDDAEMGRRLNQEAAKAIKYGGLTEEEALKLVTINPAKMLHIDHRTGSLEAGKDADLVIWSDHPLSMNARAEKTFIEGRLYFDVKTDQRLREELALERARLIQAMMNSKDENKTSPKATRKREYHCDTEVDEYWIEE